MSRKYFGTDGVRGEYNKGYFTKDFVAKLTKSAGIWFSKNGAKTLIIGTDTRESRDEISSIMSSVFKEVGLKVINIGIAPTPVIAGAVDMFNADFAVVISASHNPWHDNGIKFFLRNAQKLSDNIESEIEAIMLGIDDEVKYDIKNDNIINDELKDAQKYVFEQYKINCEKIINGTVDLKEKTIVIDAANGAAYQLAEKLFTITGANLVIINNNPNGKNINENCGATDLTSLKNKVLEIKADIGIAFDGDSDRIMMVDEKGEEINGDKMLAVIALSMKNSGKLSKNTLVFTLDSNIALNKYCEKEDINTAITNVGDRYVAQEMQDNGYNIGGERSGHILIGDCVKTGDGILTGLYLCKEWNKFPDKLASEFFQPFEDANSVRINIRFEGDNPLDRSDVINKAENIKDRLKDTGRLLLRKSGTEPLIRILIEGTDAKLNETLANELKEIINNK